MIHGRNLIILADGVAIAAAKSCEISVNTEAYEVSSPATAGWRYRKVGRSEWSVSVSTLVTEIRTRFNLGQIVTLTMAVCDANGMTTDRMTGTAFIKKSEITAQLGNLVQGSFSFQGIGILLPYTPPPPLYDAKIEYLESTGTQYIDTGYYPNNKTVLHAKYRCATIGTTPLFVRWTGASTYDTFGIYIRNATPTDTVVYYGLYSAAKYVWISDSIVDILNDVELTIGLTSVTLNNETVSITRDNFTSTYPLWLFIGNNMGELFAASHARMYSCTISEDGVTLLNLIPVRKGDVGYLFDEVSNTLLENAGSGNFILGPDIIEE